MLAFVAAQPLAQLHISAVTLAELRFGIERLADQPRRAALQAWREGSVRPM